MSGQNFIRNLTEVASTASAWAQANITVDGTILAVNMASLKLIDSSYRESLLTLAVETTYAGLPTILASGQKLDETEEVFSVCDVQTLNMMAEMIAQKDIVIEKQLLTINLRQMSLIVADHRNCVLGLAVGRAYAQWVEELNKPVEVVAEVVAETVEALVEETAETVEAPVEETAETVEALVETIPNNCV